MSTLFGLVAAPIATYLVSAVVNALRGKKISDPVMLGVVGVISTGVTVADTFVTGAAVNPTNLVGTFLAGLASTFFHQLYTKVTNKTP